MTRHNSPDDAAPTAVESIIDLESLRDDPEVPFHEERDVIDPEMMDEFASLPDLAGVGIVNPDGDALLRRATDTCSWKIPVVNVGPDEGFAGKLTEHVRETIGFDVELDAVEGVWTFALRTEDESRTAAVVRHLQRVGRELRSGRSDADRRPRRGSGLVRRTPGRSGRNSRNRPVR